MVSACHAPSRHSRRAKSSELGMGPEMGSAGAETREPWPQDHNRDALKSKTHRVPCSPSQRFNPHPHRNYSPDPMEESDSVSYSEHIRISS
jgi:hypothetical protein